jgi:hypothetical protein
MSFQIYIDYDEDPKIGGQQGVYYLGDSGHTHDFSDLIGCKIVGMKFNEKKLDALSCGEGRVLVLTLEKCSTNPPEH